MACHCSALKMFWESILLVLFAAGCVFASYSDEIYDLPGLNNLINFRHYSGYLNASEGKYLHYWFVESQNLPEYAPVLLWMNGGPGCSSMEGLFNELGPFKVKKDGRTVSMNPFSWNKLANIIFLESPAKVGYSYSESEDYTMDDDISTQDNYLALQHFFQKFPQFRRNDFYIAGESYAGVYVPLLSLQVVKEAPDINFKGFAIGNGFLDASRLHNSIIFFAYYHGLIGQETWDSLVEYCCNGIATRTSCNFVVRMSVQCQEQVEYVADILDSVGLNYYNIYAECENSDSDVSNSLRDASARSKLKAILRKYRVNNHVPPCIDVANVTYYLNQPTVRQALHIPSYLPRWGLCSDNVQNAYNRQYSTMRPHILELISQGKRGLIYNGDVDLACNFLGDEWFFEDLHLPVLRPYKPWFFNEQVAGFTKSYENLTFTTIKGAGHMVPQDKPEEAYKMIQAFFKNKPLRSSTRGV